MSALVSPPAGSVLAAFTVLLGLFGLRVSRHVLGSSLAFLGSVQVNHLLLHIIYLLLVVQVDNLGLEETTVSIVLKDIPSYLTFFAFVGIIEISSLSFTGALRTEGEPFAAACWKTTVSNSNVV